MDFGRTAERIEALEREAARARERRDRRAARAWELRAVLDHESSESRGLRGSDDLAVLRLRWQRRRRTVLLIGTVSMFFMFASGILWMMRPLDPDPAAEVAGRLGHACGRGLGPACRALDHGWRQGGLPRPGDAELGDVFRHACVAGVAEACLALADQVDGLEVARAWALRLRACALSPSLPLCADLGESVP